MRITEDTRNLIIVIGVILTLFLTFTGFRLPHLILFYNSIFGVSDATSLSSNNIPIEFLGYDIFDISPEFMVVQKINLLKGSEITWKEDLVFEITFENEGYEELASPWFFVQILDPLDRVWARSDYPGFGTKKIKIRYSLPSPNKKMVGTWKIVSTVYELEGHEVTSFAIIEFQVIESHQYILYLVVGVILPLGLYLFNKVFSHYGEIRINKATKRMDDVEERMDQSLRVGTSLLKELRASESAPKRTFNVDWNLSGDVKSGPYGKIDIPGSDSKSKLIVEPLEGEIKAKITCDMKGLNPISRYKLDVIKESMIHSPDFPGRFSDTFRHPPFTTDGEGCVKEEFILRSKDFPNPGVHKLSVFINDAAGDGRTILISDNFSISAGS